MPGFLKNRLKFGTLFAFSIFLFLQTAIAGSPLIMVNRADRALSLEVTGQKDVSFALNVAENDSISTGDNVFLARVDAGAVRLVQMRQSDSISKLTSLPSFLASHNWLLVIGIDKYSQLRSLANSVHDCKAVKEMLTEHYGFDRKYIMELYDGQATKESIIGKFEELARKVKANDNVLIYFAGHGEYNQILKRGYWMPVNASTQSTSQYLPITELRIFLGAIKSRTTLVISDACFSGTLFPGGVKSGSKETTQRSCKVGSRLVGRQAFISGGNETVLDGWMSLDQHSIFAHYLIDRLSKNTDKYLTVSSLYEQVKDKVSNKSCQTPQCNAIKDTGDQGGEYLFVKQ